MRPREPAELRVVAALVRVARQAARPVGQAFLPQLGPGERVAEPAPVRPAAPEPLRRRALRVDWPAVPVLPPGQTPVGWEQAAEQERAELPELARPEPRVSLPAWVRVAPVVSAGRVVEPVGPVFPPVWLAEPEQGLPRELQVWSLPAKV
ncbi:hypothetical protein [Thermogutta sp.]|uniref:hypothetical protein n=1 Tax=Thermogutta sp. TaxID=1962930 RepID=UPI00321F8C40